MKNYNLYLNAETDKQGVLKIAGLMKMKEFFLQHPNSLVLINFHVLDQRPIKQLKGYYYYKFVPFIENYFRLSGDIKNPAESDIFLRTLSSITNTQSIKENGKFLPQLKEIDDLEFNELVLFIEDLRFKIADALGENVD